MRSKPQRTCRQDDRAKLFGPTGSAGWYREIENRLLAMGSSNGTRLALAVILPPARCEPFGRMVIERVAFFEDGFARANEIAQHAVNEGSKRGCFRLKARRADGEIDGGVVWNVQKKNLRGCRDQRPFE